MRRCKMNCQQLPTSHCWLWWTAQSWTFSSVYQPCSRPNKWRSHCSGIVLKNWDGSTEKEVWLSSAELSEERRQLWALFELSNLHDFWHFIPDQCDAFVSTIAVNWNNTAYSQLCRECWPPRAKGKKRRNTRKTACCFVRLTCVFVEPINLHIEHRHL